MLDYIPTITEEQITEQFRVLNQQIVQGQIQGWLNGELEILNDKNPILLRYIVERAQKFATGALMTGDPSAVALSMALEYMLLLNIINTGLGKTVGLTQFTDLMKGWFKSDDLGKLDDIGKNGDK